MSKDDKDFSIRLHQFNQLVVCKDWLLLVVDKVSEYYIHLANAIAH